MFRFIFIGFVIVLSHSFLNSQDGALVYAGVLHSAPESTPGSIRPGYTIGAQAKIGSPGFYMSPGIVFHRFNIEPHDKNSFINSRPAYSMVNIISNAGWEYNIIKPLKFRVFIGVSLNYVLSVDDNDIGYDLDDLYDSSFSYDYGAGITIGFITLDIKRDKSLSYFFRNTDKKGISFTCLNVGIAF